MGCRQCSPLSVVQLKGKHCQKTHCRNGVVDTFGHALDLAKNLGLECDFWQAISLSYICPPWSRSLQPLHSSWFSARRVANRVLKIEINPAERISPLCGKGRLKSHMLFRSFAHGKEALADEERDQSGGSTGPKHIHAHSVRFWRCSFQIVRL